MSTGFPESDAAAAFARERRRQALAKLASGARRRDDVTLKSRVPVSDELMLRDLLLARHVREFDERVPLAPAARATVEITEASRELARRPPMHGSTRSMSPSRMRSTRPTRSCSHAAAFAAGLAILLCVASARPIVAAGGHR